MVTSPSSARGLNRSNGNAIGTTPGLCPRASRTHVGGRSVTATLIVRGAVVELENRIPDIQLVVHVTRLGAYGQSEHGHVGSTCSIHR